MTDLVACVSSGKGTIAHVEKVVNGEEWEKVFLITNEEFKSLAPTGENVEMIVIDRSKMLFDIIQDVKNALNGKLNGLETAVNIVSGEGKEHMAIISAILQLGAGIRMVALTKEGVKSF